ncbi:MAG: hypothetical protein GXP41_08825 [Chloroflexi bacterium]|nr:hypothetical protein [Chloroflexota bacterium]
MNQRNENDPTERLPEEHQPAATRGGKNANLVQIIHLQPADDTAVIRDELRRAQGGRVVLVVPAACHALERERDLRLLARYAVTFDRNVAIVTDNSATRRLARQTGYSVFAETRQAQSARKWNTNWRPPQRTAVKRRPRAGARSQASLSPRPLFSPSDGPDAPPSRLDRLLTIALFAILIVLLVGGTLLVAPSAEVFLVPATRAVSVRVPIQADPGVERIDYEAGKIPARVVNFSLEGNADAATTGRQDVADARAQGQVVFINRTVNPVTVPQGTIVSASSGTPVRFRVMEDTLIPPGFRQRAVANIEAVDPGPRGNMDVLVINRVEGPLALSIEVVNNQPTTGGGVKQVSVVTNADKKGLRQLLLSRLRQEGITALHEQLEEGEFLPEETISVRVEREVFDKAVDEQAQKLHLSLRVRLRGIVVSDVAAAALAKQALHAQTPDQYAVRDDTIEYRRGPIERLEGNVMFFTMEVTGQAVANIDTRAVRETISGQSLADARALLVQKFPLAGDPLIRITPSWIKHLPWLSFRVFVHVKEA